MKIIGEFNYEEEKEYNKRSQELSRRPKKIKKDGLKDENVEDFENYWEDYENEVEIREADMKERIKEMIKSGYWTEDELKNMPGQSYRHLDISSVLE